MYVVPFCGTRCIAENKTAKQCNNNIVSNNNRLVIMDDYDDDNNVKNK